MLPSGSVRGNLHAAAGPRTCCNLRQVKRSGAKKLKLTSGRASRVKGKLVEAVVAAMHDMRGVVVRQNVMLPPLIGTGRAREIDVLIDATVIGYPVRLAIECKNERQVVGAPEIDAFCGKLAYLGIPAQHGIFVSVKGYTRGATERAHASGLRLLVLTGLTEDRLRAVLHEALQSIVYLLPTIIEWSVVNNVEQIDDTSELGCFFSEDGAFVGSVSDLVWRAWHDGEVPARLGEHHLELRIPPGWRNVVRGQPYVPIAVAAKVRIYGLTIGISGTATVHELINFASREQEKARITASWEPNAQPQTLGTFATEEELAEALVKRSAMIKITTRLRLPRIRIGQMLWPLSEQAARKFEELIAPDAEGRRGDPWQIDLASLEPHDFRTLFAPIRITETLRHILGMPLPEKTAG